MTPTEYRQMLTDALAKPGDNTTWVLTLVGAQAAGLGARGELINENVRAYSKPDVRRMLRKLDTAEAETAAFDAIPKPVIAGGRISVGCAPCGLSVDAPNNDFGRTLIAHWPAIHAKDCKPAKRTI